MVDTTGNRLAVSPARTRPSAQSRPELQALAKGLKIRATQSTATLAAEVETRLGSDAEREAVRVAFALIDKNGDKMLSRIEVIKALRTQPSVQALLSLPATIRQEDGTFAGFESHASGCERHSVAVAALPAVDSSLGRARMSGTRDLFERVYQRMDADDSKSVTLEEFEAVFLPPPPPTEAPAPTWKAHVVPIVGAVLAATVGVLVLWARES
jgi:hypothetical protein